MPDETNLMHWKGTLKGPTGTPYEGGIFKIDIQLPADYPFVPPKVQPWPPLTQLSLSLGQRGLSLGPSLSLSLGPSPKVRVLPTTADHCSWHRTAAQP